MTTLTHPWNPATRIESGYLREMTGMVKGKRTPPASNCNPPLFVINSPLSAIFIRGILQTSLFMRILRSQSVTQHNPVRIGNFLGRVLPAAGANYIISACKQSLVRLEGSVYDLWKAVISSHSPSSTSTMYCSLI